jgi:hypothetical protein
MSKRKREDDVDILINSFNKKIKINRKRSFEEETFISNKKLKIDNYLEKENHLLKEGLDILLNENNKLKFENDILKDEIIFLKNKDNLIDFKIYPLV